MPISSAFSSYTGCKIWIEHDYDHLVDRKKLTMFVLVTFEIDHIPEATMGLSGLNRKLILAFLLLVENRSIAYQQIEGDERNPKIFHLSYLMPVFLQKNVETVINEVNVKK